VWSGAALLLGQACRVVVFTGAGIRRYAERAGFDRAGVVLIARCLWLFYRHGAR
jgi:hypothetical protein